LAWQVGLELLQPLHDAVTLGPSRLPQVSLVMPLELELDVALELPPVLALVLVLELVVVVPPPHTLATGTQTWSCDPSAPETWVQARSGEQACAIEQSGAQ
jgi:hypothetical protein